MLASQNGMVKRLQADEIPSLPLKARRVIP
jgi:hypothetical protein